MQPTGLLTIGELARRAGLATSAVRYYERIGLLQPAERVGQQRRYQASDGERVALIRLFQDAGFTLAEIGYLITATATGGENWRQLAEKKEAELDTRITAAQRGKDLVNHALECPHPDLFSCPRFRSAVKARLED